MRRQYAGAVKPSQKEPSAALRQAYEAAVREVEATADPAAAVVLAGSLVTAADAIVSDAARLRARMTLRLLDSERLSLAELARRIGTSKSRADQLVRAARAALAEEAE
jgi:hypothetical protein